MKIKLIAIVLSFAGFVNSQNYVPDTSFGTNGSVVTNYNMYYDNDQAPSNCFYVNNRYIFTQKTQMSAFTYDGNIDFNFGTLGYSRLVDPTLVYNIRSSKLIGNYIYLMGLKTNGSSIRLGFVAKMSTDGILDNSFGVGGISSFPIEAAGNSFTSWDSESGVYDLVIKNGFIFTVGATFQAPITPSYANYAMFVSKLSLNGIIDSTFDINGYKLYTNEFDVRGRGIFSYENDLLLVAEGNGGQIGSRKILIKVDENGEYVNSFGTNGVKIRYICVGCSSWEKNTKVTLQENYLYMLTNHYQSAPGAWNAIQRVDILSFETINLAPAGSYSNYYIENDKIYILGCNHLYTDCPNAFYLVKRNLIDGTLDLSFNQNGEYSYNIPTTAYDRASVLIRHTDGKMMIGGFGSTGSSGPSQAPYGGFAMARITDVLLNSNDFNRQNNFSVVPNPVQNNLTILNEKNRTIEKIYIFDVSGKIVYENNSYDAIINVEQFAAGIYYIKIYLENKTELLKFIKN